MFCYQPHRLRPDDGLEVLVEPPQMFHAGSDDRVFCGCRETREAVLSSDIFGFDLAEKLRDFASLTIHLTNKLLSWHAAQRCMFLCSLFSRWRVTFFQEA